MAKGACFIGKNRVDYEVAHYLRNSETDWFEKEPELCNFPRLPQRLKVETTQEKKLVRNGADYIITGPIRNGKREFFTGLRKTGYQLLRHGNDTDKSEIVFLFSRDFGRMTIFYFRGYTCFPNQRKSFYDDVLVHLRGRGCTV